MESKQTFREPSLFSSSGNCTTRMSVRDIRAYIYVRVKEGCWSCLLIDIQVAVHSSSNYCVTDSPSAVCTYGGAALYQYYRTKICGDSFMPLTGKAGCCNAGDSTGTPSLPHIVTPSLHFTSLHAASQPATHKPSTLYKDHGMENKGIKMSGKVFDHRTDIRGAGRTKQFNHRTVGVAEVAAVYLRIVMWCNRGLRCVACVTYRQVWMCRCHCNILELFLGVSSPYM
jgi:hypothetical protein